MTVQDASEVQDLNRKQRNKMAVVQGRPGSHRGDDPGRRAHLRNRRRRHRRAGGLHDRPLRGRRLLPREHPARHRREPQRPRHALRAAGLRDRLHPARFRPRPRRAAQPLLRLRRGRATGPAGRRASNWSAANPPDEDRSCRSCWRCCSPPAADRRRTARNPMSSAPGSRCWSGASRRTRRARPWRRSAAGVRPPAPRLTTPGSLRR